jgi:hypothetical protein
MVMNMNVLSVMVVAVLVLNSGYMKMNMFVGPVPVCRAKTPDKIRDAKTYHQPRSEIAANGFEPLELIDGYTEGNARKSEDNRTSDVPDSAQESYHYCLKAGPLSGPGNHNKRQVMVGAEKCVEKT